MIVSSTEDGIEARQPCLTSLTIRNSPLLLTAKFYIFSTVAVDHSQKPASELWQHRLLKYIDNPGVIDVVIYDIKISQQNTRLMRDARNVRQDSRLNFEDVVHHMPDRDATLTLMCASRCVSLKVTYTDIRDWYVPTPDFPFVFHWDTNQRHKKKNTRSLLPISGHDLKSTDKIKTEETKFLYSSMSSYAVYWSKIDIENDRQAW